MLNPTIRRYENIIRSPWLLIGLLVAGGLAVPVLVALTFPLWKWVLNSQFSFSLVVMGIMLFTIVNATAVCIWAERKVAALTQDRHGPNRVGFWGLFQSLADGVKLILKENIVPRNVEKPIFLLAPALAFVMGLLGFAIIPWGGVVEWPWQPGTQLKVMAADVNIGLLYFLAIGSLGIYSVVLAGYASNNKYAFYGGMRASAQMISYELPLGLAILVVLLTTGSLQLDVIVNQQAASGLWYVFLHPIAFFLVLVAAFAETNRAPFDLAEAEQELVAGYHTEYSGMGFGMFFLGEYAHMITNSAIMAALFFGGWAPLPFMSWLSFDANGAIESTWWNTGWVAMLIKVGVFLGKIVAFIFLYMLVRWTIPRFRFDQLMRICWQSLVPVGIVLLAGTGTLVYFGLERNIVACLALNAVLLVILLVNAARARRPVTGRQGDLPDIRILPGGASA